MNCIVTAGPTYEPLDGARRITNFSTGRLGCELANHLFDRGHKVSLLLGEQSTWNGPLRVTSPLRFSTGSDLSSKLAALAGTEAGAVFHAAAVADFCFGRAWRRNDAGQLDPVREGKFQTEGGPLMVELTPTPKIIANLRSWFPRAFIVGWKYEVEGDRQGVMLRAAEQIRRNSTDACVANGPGYGAGCGIVLADGTATHAQTHDELFAALAALIPAR